MMTSELKFWRCKLPPTSGASKSPLVFFIIRAASERAWEAIPLVALKLSGAPVMEIAAERSGPNP